MIYGHHFPYVQPFMPHKTSCWNMCRTNTQSMFVSTQKFIFNRLFHHECERSPKCMICLLFCRMNLNIIVILKLPFSYIYYHESQGKVAFKWGNGGPKGLVLKCTWRKCSRLITSRLWTLIGQNKKCLVSIQGAIKSQLKAHLKQILYSNFKYWVRGRKALKCCQVIDRD